MERKIRLMIIDDSAVYRNWLITQLSKDEHLEIIGYATDAFDASKKIPVLKPDVLTLDIEMPGMSGLDFLKELLPRHPLPVILVSSLNIKVFDALAAGAVDFVRKPDMNSHISKDAFLSMLISKLIVASQSKIRIPPSQTAPATSSRRISGKVTIQTGIRQWDRHRHRRIHGRHRGNTGSLKAVSPEYAWHCHNPAHAPGIHGHVRRTPEPAV